MLDLDRLDFAKGQGFVTVVAQDAISGAVLMVARADREALERTIATGEMHYHSRTRGLWRKGETSGNTQKVVALLMDCDGDSILARVIPAGPACHTGAETCFGTFAEAGDILSALDATIGRRMGDAASQRGAAGADGGGRGASSRESSRARGAPPETQGTADARSEPHHAAAPSGESARDVASGPAKPSYTRRLLADRNLRLKKLGEEAAELIAACADGDRERAVEETADIIYHALVALRATGGRLDDVREVLAERRGTRESGGGRRAT